MRSIEIQKKSKEEIVKKAVKALKKGNVIVFPTDTVYGFLVNATDRKAVQKIFLIKGRKKGKPLPIFIKDIAMAKTLAKVSFAQEKYMKKVWPGKVTLILNSRGVLPKETGTKDCIGLRIPKYVLLQKILRKVNCPLTGTSANLTGKLSFLEGEKVINEFKSRRYKPDIVFDTGKLSYSRPSKVVDITGIKPKVLRK